MSKRKPEQAPKSEAPRCPFCGRRITVRRIDDGLYHCDHCQRMFRP